MAYQPVIPSVDFYSPETPPKKSRLQDFNLKPPFKTFKDQLVDFDRKLSEPIKSPITTIIKPATTHDTNKNSTCSPRSSPLPLKNLGNTCYENSIIQCLFSLDMFMDNLNRSIDRISSIADDQVDSRYRVLNAFYNLHKSYEESFLTAQDQEERQQQQQQLESRLEELKLAVGERSSQFNSTHQQDASEFFYHVIDSIQEYYQSLKTDDHDNPVTQAFELELDYMMRCPKCHHKVISESEKIRTLPLALPHVNNESQQSRNQDDDVNRIPTPPTSDLDLDSPKVENKFLDEPFDGSEEKENLALQEDVTITAEKLPESGTVMANVNMRLGLTDVGSHIAGDQQVNTSTDQQHYTLCDALNNYFEDDVLDLKCSQSDCDSGQRTKKCLIKKLPQVLFITLARYSYSGKKSLDEIEAPFELSVPFQENKSPSHSPSAHREFGEHDSNYHLVAVVCHLGSSLDAGHYTSYVYNQSNSSWYCCDDDTITKVQESEVKYDAKKSGYCFFYAHKSSIVIPSKDLLKSRLEAKMSESSDQVEEDISTVSSCIVESSAIMTPESSPSPPAISIQDTSRLGQTET